MRTTIIPVIALILCFPFVTVHTSHAQEGAMVEGAGFTLFDTESIKGSRR